MLGWGWWDPMYFVFVAPAMLLMMWAQYRLRSAYAQGQRVDARLSGAAAARYILDQAGLNDVEIEETGGILTDHYDPRHRVLRLSSGVYRGHSAASVGVAAHEAGHAIQHARHYAPLAIRNAAVPAAQFGPMLFMILLMVGMFMQSAILVKVALVCFGGVLLFQVVNLPVEFDASNRAKRLLSEYQIVTGEGAAAVRRVLNAAAWTYVAGALETLLILLYYIYRLAGSSRDE